MNKRSFKSINKSTVHLLKLAHEAGEGTTVSTDRALASAIIFVDENNNVLKEVEFDIFEQAMQDYGMYALNWSKTFHKSLEKVANADIDQLIFEQLVHYFSTYGLESLGYEAYPVIPFEKVFEDQFENIPDRAFTIIRIVSEDTLRAAVDNFMRKTIAPHEDQIEYIKAFIDFASIGVEEVPSFEIKCMIYDYFDKVPNASDEFMRYLIYKLTASTLVCKDAKTIKLLSMKASSATKYLKAADLTVLAEYFFRYKPFYLALKSCKENAPYINKIRRLADKYHKSLGELTIQNLVSFYNKNDTESVNKIIAKSSIRQLVKVYNYLGSSECSVGVYQIRNGHRHIDLDRNIVDNNAAISLRNELEKEIKVKLNNKLAGKTYYIPSYISYAVPVSEKQFVGNYPIGTKVSTDLDAFSIGICWNNYKQRTDIDLHMTGVTGEHFGWNAGYRDTSRDIIYSGDMTDATNGAAECFFVKKQARYMLNVNLYSGEADCPFKFMITEKEVDHRARNWYDNSNTAPITTDDAIFTPINLKFNGEHSLILGLLEGKDFYFYNGNLANSIIPDAHENAQYIDSLVDRLSGSMTMKNLIELAGGQVINSLIANADDINNDEIVDLSPSTLTSRTLLDLVDN